MSNAKHAANYRLRQSAKATAQAKRVEELSEALREIAAGGWVLGPGGGSAMIRRCCDIATKALEGSAKA